jgi:transcriptional regulator with XRE-family HTH domain
MFIDGVRHESVVVTDGLTLHLGNPDGLAVRFTYSDADADVDESDWTSEETVDPDIARAGAAVAARRRELELTQRGLARDKIINAGALIAFEKGRSWPQEGTRSRLEQVLQWPPGAIAGIRDGAPAPDEERTAVIFPTVPSPLIAQTIQLALNSVDNTIAALPAETSPEFNDRVGAVLVDLRNLQEVAADAARNSPGAPALVITLGGVRRRYEDLMARAANAPNAPMGRRLHAARRRANLTAGDAALASGLPVNVIEAAEAERPVPDHAVVAIEGLISQLEA